jgi:hypothetical protein
MSIKLTSCNIGLKHITNLGIKCPYAALITE